MKYTVMVLCGAALLAGCAGNNPIDRVSYRDEPLVKDVKRGMSKEKVASIGGPPSSQYQRTAHEGSCNNYVLSREGKQQTYYVNFDAEGRVDGQGFTTCEAKDKEQGRVKL